jgi:hypothetical protein
MTRNAEAVLLEFRVDDTTLKEDTDNLVLKLDPAILEQTCFVMPVRFRVNSVELLGEQVGKKRRVLLPHPDHGLRETYISTRPTEWFGLPLLGFTTQAIQVLNEVVSSGRAELAIADGGYLRLSSLGDKLSITSDLNGLTATANFSHVHDAFVEFYECVRDMFLTRLPNLARHPCWTQWFPKSLGKDNRGRN